MQSNGYELTKELIGISISNWRPVGFQKRSREVEQEMANDRIETEPMRSKNIQRI